MRSFGRYDLVILAGLGLVVYGVSLIHLPSAFILAGLLITAIGYFASASPTQ